MTVIKASLKDQTLTVSTAPVVASGGVEEDVVAFEFDSTWAEYVKKAVFYRDESNVYHVDVGSDNTAVIPWEVLQQAGYMYFGVFGTKGSEVKTSTVAKYRVERGAITIASGLMPTPDIFSDVIANTAARHSHDNKKVLDGITADDVTKWDSNSESSPGVGIQSVKQTTTSTEDGGTNVITVTKTDGTSSTFTVRNGSKGSTGATGATGADGEDGATFTPSVSAAGTLSWTNNKGLTNPISVNVRGPAGAAGKDGYTPVKGTDYWTEDDIATIQSYIDEKATVFQSKSITDTGRYFHTDTVEGALQEIGAELAGVNVLLGSGIQISFTIDDGGSNSGTFSAVSGETWTEWIGTGRLIFNNGLMLYIYGGVVATEAGVYALSLDGSTAVSGGDKIVSGATYTIISWGG